MAEIAVTWNAGKQLAYIISQEEVSPGGVAITCFGQEISSDIQPRIAAGEPGQFSIVYGSGTAEMNSPVRLLEISPDGAGPETEIGQGRFPEIFHNADGLHLAWCTPEGQLNYSAYVSPDVPVETLSSPPCINRPGILQDTQGLMHLVWYSDQIQDNFGNPRPGNFMYESILMDGNWIPRPSLQSSLNLLPFLQSACPAADYLPCGWTHPSLPRRCSWQASRFTSAHPTR